MKKTNIIALLLTLFVLCSCGKEYYDTYKIKNSTNHLISIEGFATKWSIEEDNKYKEIITINSDSFYSVDKSVGETWQTPGIFKLGIIDSVNIIFDNTRIIKYVCNKEDGYKLCNDQRNIINYQEYYVKNCGEHECTYTYTITEEDYESAEVIVKKIT